MKRILPCIIICVFVISLCGCEKIKKIDEIYQIEESDIEESDIEESMNESSSVSDFAESMSESSSVFDIDSSNSNSSVQVIGGMILPTKINQAVKDSSEISDADSSDLSHEVDKPVSSDSSESSTPGSSTQSQTQSSTQSQTQSSQEDSSENFVVADRINIDGECNCIEVLRNTKFESLVSCKSSNENILECELDNLFLRFSSRSLDVKELKITNITNRRVIISNYSLTIIGPDNVIWAVKQVSSGICLNPNETWSNHLPIETCYLKTGINNISYKSGWKYKFVYTISYP